MNTDLEQVAKAAERRTGPKCVCADCLWHREVAAALRRAARLERHIRHGPGCASMYYAGPDPRMDHCDCGLREALDAS